jgi:hypothetical protein
MNILRLTAALLPQPPRAHEHRRQPHMRYILQPTAMHFMATII